MLRDGSWWLWVQQPAVATSATLKYLCRTCRLGHPAHSIHTFSPPAYFLSVFTCALLYACCCQTFGPQLQCLNTCLAPDVFQK